MEKKEVRLQKLLSECGIASRRKAEEIIAQGRVKVNGTVAKVGDSVVPEKDRVTVDGKTLEYHNERVYIALNKPRGFVTTLEDELGRKCITELVNDIGERVYPVGRLDKDSEGLLLLTNDGEFTNAMTHPSHHVPKIYRVSVRPEINKEQIRDFEEGIEIDGRKTAPAKIRIIRQEPGRSVLEITLFEGRNRQIRKMCETMGLDVARLSRIQIGNLKLGSLENGKWRRLTEKEVVSLYKAAGLNR